MPRSSARVLVLSCEPTRMTGTVDAHLRAFKRYSRHEFTIVDSLVAARIGVELAMFDAVVFHYSVVLSNPKQLPEDFAERLGKFPGRKILFIQDEFRWTDRTAAAIRRLGIDIIFTVTGPDVVRRIYRDAYFDDVRFEHTLTGFVPEELNGVKVPAYEARGVDVAYRARRLPAWCGSFARQKATIGERFREDARTYGLVCDIEMSEASRIYGDRWIDFVSNAKALLGTESGASFVDYDGEVIKAAEDYEARNPHADFETVRDLFLEGRDGDVVIRAISPRCFEAAALRSLMIMYPGEYSGILEAGRHYVPLAPDHSNMDEVVDVLRDPRRAGAVIEAAYKEIACSGRWGYPAFMEHVDKVIDEEVLPLLPHAGRSRPPLDVDATAREAETLARYEAESRALAGRQSRKLAVAIALIRIEAACVRMARRLLPEGAAEAVIGVTRRTKGRMAPLLKRLLLGDR